ncbi:MAG: EscU/YscU/HrcU family type III secretion system export apparatus switch protein [Chitinophagaceae bacterium]|nr:EscU/YscU/HrcU family type III secretion system export apparatus switch protein [Oligoflexus sp.]
MSDGGDSDDRTEEATPERRDEFRERGEIAISKDVTSVFVLAAIMILFSSYIMNLSKKLQAIMVQHFTNFDLTKINEKTVFDHVTTIGSQVLWMIIPFFAVSTLTAMFITFSQTRLNWSWERLAPNWGRMNVFTGVINMFSMQAVVEVLKSVGKMFVIFGICYLILKGEFRSAPGLLNMPFTKVWEYWANISHTLFWSVLGLLLFIASGDFIYAFMSMEKKLKMTKEEVKEEYKKREQDPHMKAKMKRMQREISSSKSIAATKTATVVVTNPTHFAVALRYELGMSAPIVVAKGQDFTAQRMKEVAKENGILIMENKPLARTLFKVCKVGGEIPESLYKAVSEIIRYVFMLKGKNLSRPRT